MKKLKILLAVVIYLLISVQLFAQPCPPLSIDVNIYYNRGLQELPPSDTVCITIIWEFDDGSVCPQEYKGSPSDPSGEYVSGNFRVLVLLPVGDPCPEKCLSEENVKSITVIVSDCAIPPGFKVESKIEGYDDSTEIKYWL